MNHYACGILFSDGKILLGRRAAHRRAYPNCWDVIGGKVEGGETVDLALSRELSEELGITPVDYVSIGSVEDNNRDARGRSTYHLFIVRDWAGGTPTAQNDEHSRLEWFDIDAACALPDLALAEYRMVFRQIQCTTPGGPMRASSDQRRSAAQLVEEIANFIRHHQPAMILRVAVDGVDGIGKTVFANKLALAIEDQGRPVIRASVDGFHRPRKDRYRRGRASPEGFYLDSYDYAALKRVLLDPLGPGGSRAYCSAIFDHVTDSPLPVHTSIAGHGSVLVFDGIFLHRAELRGVWDLSIFLDAPFGVTIPRGAGRGPGWGSPDLNAPSNQRYIQGQCLYLRENGPQKLANFVIDYTDLANPIVVARRWPKQH
jgi:uridine kinase